MSETPPLVSIALPLYNNEATIEVTIRSILLQTYENWECLVMDDGSTDHTLEIVRRFNDPRFRVVSDGRHYGRAYQLNIGIASSRGKYLARMDGDDISYPKRLERQVAYMEAHPDVDLIGAWMVVFGKDGVALGRRSRTLPRHWPAVQWIFRSFPLPHPTFFGKTAWFRQNPYATWPTQFEDQQLLITTFRTSHFEVLPEILLGYREEQLILTKQVRYRKSFFQARRELARSMGRTYTSALLAVQAAKLALEAVMITTGLTRVILRNRAAALSLDELQKWELVWKAVNQTEAVTSAAT